MTLTFDLVSIFGVPVNPDIGMAFGQSIVDRIVDRTQGENRRADGPSFRRYSESYEESQAFADFGKSGSVDLTLTGDMLLDIDILELTPSRLVVGFSDQTQTAKAFNHHTGDTVPARPFFDINKSELDELVDEFQPEIESDVLASETQEAETRISLLDLLTQVSGTVFDVED